MKNKIIIYRINENDIKYRKEFAGIAPTEFIIENIKNNESLLKIKNHLKNHIKNIDNKTINTITDNIELLKDNVKLIISFNTFKDIILYWEYIKELKPTETFAIDGSNKTYDHINPSHYKNGSKETWEMMVDIWGIEKFITYCEMTAFKYRMRAGMKPDQPAERDLEKARWYENKIKELQEKENENIRRI